MEALDLVEEGHFDTILLDLIMPELDGFDTLQRLKRLDLLKTLPVIVVSANKDMENVVRCLELGATDHLPKPFDPSILKARLRATLSEKRLKEQEIEYRRNVDLLTQAAADLEEGEFQASPLRPLEARDDALGNLARVFSRMALEVKQKQQRLESRVQQLTAQLEEARERQAVTLTTEGLYGKATELGHSDDKTRTIVLHSVRGGTGKSQIAAHLALALTSSGQRVMVVDLAVQAPSLHLMFDYPSDQLRQATVNDVLCGKRLLPEVALDLQEKASLSKGALFFVPAAPTPARIAQTLREGYEASLLSSQLREMQAEKNIEVVILDTAPGLHEETLLALLLATEALIVLRPDPGDYEGTSVSVTTVRRLDVPSLGLIVNQVPPKDEGKNLPEHLSELFGAPVKALVPYLSEPEQNVFSPSAQGFALAIRSILMSEAPQR